ncbi:neuroplastin isoform X1 [Myzus persicae]|uniref:neuroplastin isoform X1 n=2 Tax=Myzus persicae TaxID=13164 RepID=UPI000B933E93|nr:neuroplastin isoform X1 [Myzus persicae]
MCWNSLSVVVYSVVFCALLDFGPSRVLADEPSYEGNTTVRDGDPFKITCRVSMFQVIKWQKDGHTLVTGEHFNISEAVTSDNMFVSTITANSASSMHSGAYRCTTQYNKFHVLYVVTAQATIKANYDYGDKYKIGEYKSKLTLNCNVDGTQDQKYIWKWFKGDNQITTDSEDPHHIDVSGNTLIVNRFVENDAGQYTCSLFTSTMSPVDKKVFNVVLKPYMKLPKTATFIEGEKMELECIVYGVPTPEVSWKFENTTLVPSEHIKFLPNKKNISNAILVLDPITMNDRGNFICSGKNSVVFEPVHSAASYVRIKDKMAALWPFLGICVEVILLCLVIFIYEKKRNKAEFEESDTDQGPETNNANDHSGGDVRHRK